MPTRTQVLNVLSAAVSILTAAKVDEVVKKYPDREKEIRELNDSLKTKYLEWAAKRLESESVDDLKKALAEFDNQLHRLAEKDIGKYKSLKEIQEALSGVSSQKSKREIQKGAALYEDERWLFSHPTRVEEACALGKGTPWCIAADDNEYFDEDYSKDNNVQFYILKDKEAASGSLWSKVAFLFSDGAPFAEEPYQDALNSKPSLKEVLDGIGVGVFKKFNKMALEHAKKNPKTWQWSLYNDKSMNKEEKRKLVTEMGAQVSLAMKLALFPEEVDLKNLKGVNLRGKDLKGAELPGANLAVSALTGVNLEGANLQGANLSYTALRGAILHHANLKGANLEGADMAETQLDNANLEGANLEGANLRESLSKGVNFTGANMRGMDLYSSSMDESILTNANLRGARLLKTSLYQADLRGADLRGASLRRSQLEGADLRGANLEEVNLEEARVKGANFEGATLEGANLDGALYLDGAIFGNTRYDSKTRWPRGFVPSDSFIKVD